MQNYYETNHDPNIVYDEQVDAVSRYVAGVFGWMFFGLLITAMATIGIIIGMFASPAFADLVLGLLSSPVIFIVLIGQMALVGFLSARAVKMQTTTAVGMYLLYAATNGLTVGLISVLILQWNMALLGTAFGITAASFGIMAAYGYVTKKDLTSMGSLLFMGLIGIILASVVNWFLGNAMLDFIICVVGLFIFLGLVAYDTQKIKGFYRHAQSQGTDGARVAGNLAIVGALMLYLDFINIFLFVVRLLGRRR